MRSVLRTSLRILKWTGLGLSTLLFAAVIAVWVRSLGQEEHWSFERVDPVWPEKTAAGVGVERTFSVRAIHSRLWLTWSTWDAPFNHRPLFVHMRDPITADRAQEEFDSLFRPGVQPWKNGAERAWRFLGAGLRHKFDGAVNPRTGEPRFDVHMLAIRFWMLTVLSGLWPLLFLSSRLLRRERHAQGSCPTCGYDLRATPDPAGPRLPRCPECGRVPDAPVPGR